MEKVRSVDSMMHFKDHKNLGNAGPSSARSKRNKTRGGKKGPEHKELGCAEEFRSHQ